MTNVSYSIANTGTSGPSLIGAIQTYVNGGNITSGVLSGSGVTAQNLGPIATSTSTSLFTVTYAPGQGAHPANNFGSVAAQTISIIGVAYNFGSSNTIAPINFGVLHVGDLTAARMLTITNTTPPGVL